MNFGSLVAALQHYIDAGELTVKQLAHWAGCEERTVYNYLAGNTDPTYRTVNLWLQRMQSDVRLHVGQAAFASTGLIVCFAPDSDGGDMLAHAVRANGEAHATLKAVHAATEDNNVTVPESEQIDALASDAIVTLQQIKANLPRQRMKVV
jgi:hypothetical protein